MRAPTSREKFDALRAELDAVWRAEVFDAHAASVVYAQLQLELERQPGYRTAYARHRAAGQLAPRVRWRARR